MKHIFKLDATWEGGRNSKGIIEAGNLKSTVSIPVPMGGPGVGTNPDEMLLGAASTCYLITLAAMLERAGIVPASHTLHSEATVDVTNNIFTFESIVHRPTIELKEGSDTAIVEHVRRLAMQAEGACMISRAVAGNVQVTAEPVINIVCN
ncbi:peroxiredoxin-like protein [Paenibacillus turicensis]|uniref:Peroxiredoxin-like protein n=1 Tax=Paenibacillus turicensis TaxID=160487 RepID=A0ABS4FVB1_9BACL|nr:OsmC family protein [Paenibacillus turicensis]MBP1906517.1 peroxiredoxin-like protein [Paenibacillus turicensis]